MQPHLRSLSSTAAQTARSNAPGEGSLGPATKRRSAYLATMNCSCSTEWDCKWALSPLCVCLGNKAVPVMLGNHALLLQHVRTLQGISAASMCLPGPSMCLPGPSTKRCSACFTVDVLHFAEERMACEQSARLFLAIKCCCA